MRFYRGQHGYDCGVDLHARTMYLCILDRQGQIVVNQRIPSRREAFIEAVEPFLDDLAVCAECIFCWYWHEGTSEFPGPLSGASISVWCRANSAQPVN